MANTIAQYGPAEFIDKNGEAVPNIEVTVYLADEITLANLYADQLGTPLANPLPIGVSEGDAGIDIIGNGIFYANTDNYFLSVEYQNNIVWSGPVELVSIPNITADTTDATRLGGSFIDGDDFSFGKNGLVDGRITQRFRVEVDGLAQGVDPSVGAGIVHNGFMRWGNSDGSLGNPNPGANYLITTLDQAPDKVSLTFRPSSLTAQGAPATTWGANSGLIVSSASSSDGYQCAVRSVHGSLGGKYWSLGIFDADNVMGLGAGLHILTTNGGFNMAGSYADDFLIPDRDYTVSIERIGNQLILTLADGTVQISDPNDWIPIFWGNKVVVEAFQPSSNPTIGALYATDHAALIDSWNAYFTNSLVVLDQAANASIPRDIYSKIALDRLPASWMSKYSWALVNPVTPGWYISTPDSPALSITNTPVFYWAEIEPVTWRPVTQQTIIAKGDGTVANSTLNLALAPNGALQCYWYPADGSTPQFSTGATSIPSGTTGPLFVGVLFNPNDAGAHSAKFYTSVDGVSWTQLGSTASAAGVTDMKDSTAPVVVGSIQLGLTQRLIGNIYSAGVRAAVSGVDIVKYVPNGLATYIAPTGETWTVHGDMDYIALAQTQSFLTPTDANALANAAPMPISPPSLAGVSDIGIPGIVFTSVNTLNIVANNLFYWPFEVRHATTLNKFHAEVTTIAAVGSKAWSAVFTADALWQPGTLVAESGQISTDALGVSHMTPIGGAKILLPGRYLLAFTANAAVTMRAFVGASPQIPIVGQTIGVAPFALYRVATRTYTVSAPATGPAWTFTQRSAGLSYHPALLEWT